MQVKPVYVDPILEALKQHVTPEHLIISIVAGVKLAALESSLPEGSRVVHLLNPLFSISPLVTEPAQTHLIAPSLQVRVMPNMPCLIGQCASAYVIGNNASEEDSVKTFALMSAVGACDTEHACFLVSLIRD